MQYYELIKGTPTDIIILKCIECNNIIMKAPLNCIVKPDRGIVLNNMRCMLANHKITVVKE